MNCLGFFNDLWLDLAVLNGIVVGFGDFRVIVVSFGDFRVKFSLGNLPCVLQ